MNSEASAIVRAVLEGNVEEVRNCLANGSSHNEVWGTSPLVVHAALLPSLAIFRLLLEHGATIPRDFLHEVITWELGDWRICSNDEEQEFIRIIKLVRKTSAWLPTDQRRELVSRLEGYGLTSLIEALLEEGSQSC
jgi:hypothetical protein